MYPYQKIAVIGGTGRAGTDVVECLLDKGFSVKVLLRRPEAYNLTHPHLEIVRGDVRDEAAVFRLLEGCDAVISTLGQRKGEPAPFGTAARNQQQAMRTHHIRRYVGVTGLSTDLPGDRKSPGTRLRSWLMKRLFAQTVADKAEELRSWQTSGLDWTMLRLPFIRVSKERHPVRADLYDCPGKQIGSADLAAFIVQELVERQYVQQAPFLSN